MGVSPTTYSLICLGVLLLNIALATWRLSTPQFKQKPEPEQLRIRRMLKWSIATLPISFLVLYFLYEVVA